MTTTQEGGRWESHSMKRLTLLLQGSYQHCKWQTVAGVITRRAWAWLQGSTCSAQEKVELGMAQNMYVYVAHKSEIDSNAE